MEANRFGIQFEELSIHQIWIETFSERIEENYKISKDGSIFQLKKKYNVYIHFGSKIYSNFGRLSINNIWKNQTKENWKIFLKSFIRCSCNLDNLLSDDYIYSSKRITLIFARFL